ncbi:MAG: TonB-dependent receptor [Bacteroidales bacterium]|nr:TonB-dependent receptor [Bacteroidales bacterium]MDY0198418.1 TonB-dependent receptor [Tenuifilaceae bacterium]
MSFFKSMPGRLCILTVAFFILGNSFSALSQTIITGIVKDSGNKSPIPFVNVVLFNQNDTTNYVHAGISDLNGAYLFENLEIGKNYTIKASHIGYKQFSSKVSVLEKKRKVLDIPLVEETIELEHVEVYATRSRIGIDKSTFTILPEDVEKSKSSLDLVEIIPSINIDRLNRTIADSKGRSVKILINGMNATERDLIALQPNRIAKIEHYDIPPARFAEYGAVINVVTIRTNDGGVLGFDLQHSVTTGFGNDDLYFKFQNGRNIFSASYALRYRDYTKRYITESYDYQFNGTTYQRLIESAGKFGYKDNYIDIGYIRQQNDKYAVQLRLSPNFDIKDSETTTNVTNRIGSDLVNGEGDYLSDGLMFNPVIDGYFWIKLSEKNSLIVNVVGTGYYSENSLRNLEKGETGDTLLLDKMKSNIDKNSIIAETVLSRNFGKSVMDIGYRFQHSASENIVKNSFNNPTYRTTNISNYLYTDLRGKYHKFSYIVRLGLTNTFFSESFSDNDYSRWTVNPTLSLGYNINDGNGLKFIYATRMQEPSLSELSNNKIFIAQDIVQQGNPELKPFRGHGFMLGVFHYDRYLNIELNAVYGRMSKFITTRYALTANHIALTPINEYDAETYGFEYSCILKPKKWINIRINGSAIREFFYSDVLGNESHSSYPLSGSLNFYYKKVWLLSYQQTMVSKSIDGPYLISCENSSNIGFSYQGKPIQASINVFWPFTHAKYDKETLHSSIVNHQRHTKIMDNASMITFSIGYTFQFGEQLTEGQRKLKNKDTDSGVFLK